MNRNEAPRIGVNYFRDNFHARIQSEFEVRGMRTFPVPDEKVSKLSSGEVSILLLDAKNVHPMQNSGYKIVIDRPVNSDDATMRDELGSIRGVNALDAGADGYFPANINPDVLAAFTKALLRRISMEGANGTTLRMGELQLDNQRRTALLGDEPLVLRNKQFTLLSVLLQEAGLVVTRNSLLSRVWDSENYNTRTVDVHVSQLRRKLQGSGFSINAIRGIGYKLVTTDEKSG